MVYPLECTSTVRQVYDQYIIWCLPSPTLANSNFSHVHLPLEIPPLYPKHFLPCKMKGVAHSNPFEVDRSPNFTLEGIFVFFPKNHMQALIRYQSFLLHLPTF